MLSGRGSRENAPPFDDESTALPSVSHRQKGDVAHVSWRMMSYQVFSAPYYYY